MSALLIEPKKTAAKVVAIVACYNDVTGAVVAHVVATEKTQDFPKISHHRDESVDYLDLFGGVLFEISGGRFVL